MRRTSSWVAISAGVFLSLSALAFVIGWSFGHGLADGLIDGLACFVDDDEQEGHGEADSIWNWKWFLDWLPQIIMAAFTISLWWVSRSQRRIASQQQRLLEKTDRKADTNIELTRRSVEAMEKANHIALDIGRGRMLFVAARLNHEANGATYQFINNGNASLFLRGIAFHYEVATLPAGRAPDNRPKMNGGRRINQSIDPKGVYDGEVRFESKVFNEDGSLKNFTMTFLLVFDTVGTIWSYRVQWSRFGSTMVARLYAGGEIEERAEGTDTMFLTREERGKK